MSTTNELRNGESAIFTRVVEAVAQRDGMDRASRIFSRCETRANLIMGRWRHSPEDGDGGFPDLFQAYGQLVADQEAERKRRRAELDAHNAAIAPSPPDPTVVPIDILDPKSGKLYRVRFPVEAVELLHDPQEGMKGCYG